MRMSIFEEFRIPFPTNVVSVICVCYVKSLCSDVEAVGITKILNEAE